jgi:cytochrome b
MMPAPTTQVWDPVVRVGHWVLVIAFAVAYFIEDETLQIHSWAGYVVAAYVVVRAIWGFVGSQHARFSDFLFSPVKGLAYLTDLVRKRAPRYLGHSPAGAMMVFALLLALSGTVITGMAELALSRGEGLFSLFLEQQVASPQGDGATLSGSEGEREESALKEFHELFANLTLILVGFHIAGVVIASVVHKESLVLAMITGRKRCEGAPH